MGSERARAEEARIMGAKAGARTIGLGIVGAGRIGLIRGEIAARHPSVGWIGIAEVKADRAKEVAARIGADFITTDFRELLARPEVTAAVIATHQPLHVDPILAAVERRLPLLVEKPLATEVAGAARGFEAIQQTRVDALVCCNPRLRPRFPVGK